MANWGTLCGFITANYPNAAATEDTITLRFSAPDGREQTVHVVLRDDEWIEIRTRVCRLDQIDPRSALERNGRMTVGALAAVGEHLVLKFPLRLVDLDPDEFKVPVDRLVEQGDALEL